jgi:hypothetical protein
MDNYKLTTAQDKMEFVQKTALTYPAWLAVGAMLAGRAAKPRLGNAAHKTSVLYLYQRVLPELTNL